MVARGGPKRPELLCVLLKLLFVNADNDKLVRGKLSLSIKWGYIYLANLQIDSKLAMMIVRSMLATLADLLRQREAVVLLGPRQVGKTTLAHELSKLHDSIYLDLELPSDLAKLVDADFFFSENQHKLIILDEVQRKPELFAIIRSQIDKNRRNGRKYGQFLLLGSASERLLRQSSESLAGRVSYQELTPFLVNEVGVERLSDLWLRGGFPDSYLFSDTSYGWRQDFIRTFLERDIPALGVRTPAVALRRFWTMLAHNHSQIFNASQLAGSLGVKGQTVQHYLDIFVDLMLVGRLHPWHSNIGKRLVKTSKVYVGDSGILHALLGIESLDSLLGHPVAGASWEGFVVANVIAAAPRNTSSYFYRTRAGAEIDLILEIDQKLWAIEVTRNTAPSVSRGFYVACEDLQPDRKWVIYPGEEVYRLKGDIHVSSLSNVIQEMNSLK